MVGYMHQIQNNLDDCQYSSNFMHILNSRKLRQFVFKNLYMHIFKHFMQYLYNYKSNNTTIMNVRLVE